MTFMRAIFVLVLAQMEIQIVDFAIILGRSHRDFRRRDYFNFRILLEQQTVVQALIDHNVKLDFAGTLTTWTRWPPNLRRRLKPVIQGIEFEIEAKQPYLNASSRRMPHHVCPRHRARYLSLRYHHERMMKQCVQQQTHYNHRFVFAEFVNEKSCARQSSLLIHRKSRKRILRRLKVGEKILKICESPVSTEKNRLEGFERRDDGIGNANKTAFFSRFFFFSGRVLCVGSDANPKHNEPCRQ